MNGPKHQPLRVVASMLDSTAASKLAGLLQDELISAEIVSASQFRWDVMVQQIQADQALAILKAAELSDAELSYLATGELGGEGGLR
jgi:hypothetical protein